MISEQTDYDETLLLSPLAFFLEIANHIMHLRFDPFLEADKWEEEIKRRQKHLIRPWMSENFVETLVTKTKMIVLIMGKWNILTNDNENCIRTATPLELLRFFKFKKNLN